MGSYRSQTVTIATTLSILEYLKFRTFEKDLDQLENQVSSTIKSCFSITLGEINKEYVTK